MSIRRLLPALLLCGFTAGSAGAAEPELPACYLDRVSSSALEASVRSLTSIHRRDVRELDENDGAGNIEAVRWIAGEFGRMNGFFTVETACYKSRRFGPECNVVATRTGASADEVVVTAHLDSEIHPQAGADDNASGVAGLLEMGRILAGAEAGLPDPPVTIRLIATNGEEEGLDGSRAYVRALSREGRTDGVRMALDMDMIAYNADGVIDLETNLEHRDLALWMADLVRRYTTLSPRVVLNAWGGDHVSFLEAGIPALLTIEHWYTKTPCYHKACDRPDTLNYAYAAQVVRLNLAAVILKSGWAAARCPRAVSSR